MIVLRSVYNKLLEVVDERKKECGVVERLFEDERDLFYGTDIWKEDLSLNKKESELLGIIYSADFLSITDKVSKVTKDILLIDEEKEFFTKLFLKDFFYPLSLDGSDYCHIPSNTNNETISSVFSKFASDKLKNDLEFAGVILSINGSYFSAFGRDVRTNESLLCLAIVNVQRKEEKEMTK